jgi:PAS domain S-box-containing protein
VNFRHQLLHLLKIRKMTAAELARRSQVSKQSISNWLAGVQPRSIPEIKKVADVFGVSLDVLCFGQDFEQKTRGEVHTKISPKTSNVSTHESVPDAHLCLSLSVGFDGFPRSLSPRFKPILGWSVEELQDRPAWELVHFSDRLRTLLKITEQARSHNPGACFDSRYLSKCGELRWLRWNAITFHDEKVIYIAGREISDQYSVDTDPLIPISLNGLVQDAVSFCNRCNIFEGIEYSFHPLASGLVFSCRQAHLSSTIVGLLHEAAMCAAGEGKKTIRMDHRETPLHVSFVVRVPPNDRKPNVEILSTLIRNQSATLSVDRSASELQFRVEFPKVR